MKPITETWGMKQITHTKYESRNGYYMEREYGMLPNGVKLAGQWVLRRSNDEYVDHDCFRHDLAERYNISLETA